MWTHMPWHRIHIYSPICVFHVFDFVHFSLWNKLNWNTPTECLKLHLLWVIPRTQVPFTFIHRSVPIFLYLYWNNCGDGVVLVFFFYYLYINICTIAADVYQLGGNGWISRFLKCTCLNVDVCTVLYLHGLAFAYASKHA